MSSDEYKAAPDAPDIKALQEEAAAEVARKKQAGEYDPAELRRIEEAALTFAQPMEDAHEAEANLRVAALTELWDAKACGVQTHRGGLAGKLLVKAKRLIHKATGFFTGIWLARQVDFNDQLVKLLLDLIPKHLDLRHRMNQTEKRLDDLEDLGRDLTVGQGHLAADLDRQVRELGAGLEALTRESGKGRSQLETLLARLQDIVEKQAAAGAISPEAAQAVAAERSASRGAAYLAFEDLHRGSREDIKARQEVYVDIFADAASDQTPLLDIGCGRGEFLELCKEKGIPAQGVDINPEMAELCRERGLKVQAGDALAYLRDLPDASLGGILAAQVIEHLTLDELSELVGLAAAKLAPGAAFAAETINPQCLTTFSGAFYLDLTHQKPIHPEAARFLWQWAGLSRVEVLNLSPYPPEHRLEMYSGAQAQDDSLAASYNRNMDRLNQLLYGYQDYAVVGRK